MKKCFLFIMIAVVGFLASCKLDEDGFNQSAGVGPNGNSKGSNGPLLGTWFMKEIVIYGNISGALSYKSFTAKDYYTFNSDYSAKFSSSDPDTTLTAKYTYSATDQKLSFGPDVEDNYTVTKLTTDSLIMKSVATVTAGGPATVLTTISKLARR